MRRSSLFVWGCGFCLALFVFMAGAVRPALAAPFRGPGYELAIPAGWTPAVRSPLAVAFSAPGRMALDIYTQPLGQKSPDEYIWYSNRHVLAGTGGLRPLGPEVRRDSLAPCAPSCAVRELEWLRAPVGGGDLNRYREVNLVFPEVVYTFLLRTTEADFPNFSMDLDRVLSGFSRAALPPSATPSTPRMAGDARVEGEEAPLTEEAPLPDANKLVEGKYVWTKQLDVRFPERGLVWGLFDGYAPFEFGRLHQIERDIDARFELVMTYRDFRGPFPLREARLAAREGRLLMVTWQPWHEGRLTDPLLIPEIAAGKHDEYVRQWARAVLAFGQPVLLRFANEMNGDWDPWSVWFYGLDHSLYVQAWQRLHRIFAEEGATNAMWVWNPHDRSYPAFTWNDPHLYYPGDEFVDWIGLTAYNTGPRAGDPWRGFDEMYGAIYGEYRALYPDKPMLITEFASDEFGGDKAAWIRDALEALERYPAVKMAVWYHWPWWKWEYQLDSSPEALSAFAAGLADPYFRQGAVRWREDGPLVSRPAGW